MGAPTTLKSLLDDWQGVNRLWFMPNEPVRESESEATVAEVAQRQSLTILGLAHRHRAAGERHVAAGDGQHLA